MYFTPLNIGQQDSVQSCLQNLSFQKKDSPEKRSHRREAKHAEKGKVYFLQKHGFFSAELVKISAFFAARR
jgi:hypothetical protein